MISDKVHSIKIGGAAGQGVKSAGLYFAKIATRSGYQIYQYLEYPSLIRGGHNLSQVVFSKSPVYSPVSNVDLLIALDQNTLNLHQSELAPNSAIIVDDDGRIDFSKVNTSLKVFPIPLRKIALESKGIEIVSNMVALGATVSLMGGELKHLIELIDEEFGKNKPEICQINKIAAQAGYDFAANNYPDAFANLLAPLQKDVTDMTIDGSQAVSYAAIAAGLQFSAIYPMSPISTILEILAAKQKDHHFIFKQAEDEISAINMVIGASYGGARVLTATSGGGFSLMTEAVGLAGMTETPLVVIEGMRGGPATGLPTWSEQGDLRQVLHAAQGEFPKIILAAGDAKEAFELTLDAFNLAEKYQTPVILLVDKNILDHAQSFPTFDYSKYQVDRGKIVTETVEGYQRYSNSDDGISPRSFPGKNYFVTNSDEHDQIGYSSELIIDREQQMAKRLKKMATCAQNDLPSPRLIGPENADITIVSWGSTKGSILEAIKDYDNINYLHITWMNPFPASVIKQILQHSKYLLSIECNSTSQLAGLIQEKTGIDIYDRFTKNNGRPIYPEEIRHRINSILKSQ